MVGGGPRGRGGPEVPLTRLLGQLAAELAALLEFLAPQPGGDGGVNVGVCGVPVFAESFPFCRVRNRTKRTKMAT